MLGAPAIMLGAPSNTRRRDLLLGETHYLNSTQHSFKIPTYHGLSPNPNFIYVSPKTTPLSLLCLSPFYLTDHHQLHPNLCSITSSFFMQTLPCTSGSKDNLVQCYKTRTGPSGIGFH
ncbi:hypothetical protein GmHk_01G000841 [Glycine max]|nr:hypothetical protein GmHk_01G000841 [Glycine max]